ncbi:MAG: hypothetical protein HDR04_09085 [Lachnospiraceae bacterium]|nr:hypothetical protein [Lachnospiraceae bacterium]
MIENEYRHNRRFREYVDQYCADHDMTVEQAFKQDSVRKEFLMHTDV